VDHASGEVDVVDAQRAQLAEPHSCVHRGRPDGAIELGDGGDQRLGLVGRCEAFARPRTAGSSKPVHGLSATSLLAIARR
jgi:hypothetical protein